MDNKKILQFVNRDRDEVWPLSMNQGIVLIVLVALFLGFALGRL